MNCIAKPYKRLLAAIIDLIVLMPVIILAENAVSKIFKLQVTPIFSFSYGYTIKIDEWVMENIWQIVALYFVTKVILVYIYFVLFEISKWQGTIGKKLLKIKVTDINGQRITFKKATIRLFSKFLSAQLLIGYIMIFFTSKKQGLHDLIAKTLVSNSGTESKQQRTN
jgi:uncharacterized RDD family membrane protein YckC